MSVGGLQRQGSQESCVLDNAFRKKSSLWYRHSLRGNNGRQRQNAASLPRVCKPKQTFPTSLVDYSDPQRTTVLLEKQDNETFGFQIQTYGLQPRHSSAVEMCTFVHRVEDDSAAESAGLTAGDVIVAINGASIEGSSHQRVLDLIRESQNSLKMETVCGSVVKRIELEKRMSLLQQSLNEKQLELRALLLQEQRLTRGHRNDNDGGGGSRLHLSLDSSKGLGSPKARLRLSSDSSYRSTMTDDSDQTSVFGDLCSPGPYSLDSNPEDQCFFSRDFPLRRRLSSSSSHQHHHHHQALGRSSSSSFAGGSSSTTTTGSSSGSGSGSISSPSPSWDETRISSLFGTLPRKGRRASVRKNIFKLIPGLQRSVEEEEMGTNSQ